MINNNELIKLSDYMDYFIEKKAFQLSAHYLVLMEEPPAFPKNYQWMGHSCEMEIQRPNMPGWSKPDVKVHGIEIRYLWKQFKPMSFENWKSCTR